MTKLELINLNTKKIVLIEKRNNSYIIESIEQWIALSKFSEAYLIIELPSMSKNEEENSIKTPVDAKFVYHQEFELVTDLDFNWRPIYPLGNDTINTKLYSKFHNQFKIVPFSGKFNGNDHIIKNIQLVDTNNVGLFGSIFFGSIKNLIIENIYASSGNNIGCLAGSAINCSLENLTIRGNVYLKGKDTACVSSIFEGTINNISVIVSGEIYGTRSRSIFINNFSGIIEKANIINNIKIDCGYFNQLSGKLNNSNLISTYTIYSPFYKNSVYHYISNCYYLQLNNNMLPDIQDITNSYFANLETINVAHNSTFDDKYWLQVNDRYYLKNLINYTNGQKISRIKYYDWINNETNLLNNIYINNNKEIVSDVPINKINIQIINDMNNKFQEYLNRENEIISIRMEKINKNIKLKIINLKHRLDDWNPLEPNLVNSEVNDLTEIDDKIFLDELNLDINKIEIDNELYETTSQATLSEYSNLTEKSSVSSNKVKLNNVISKFENTVLTYKKEGKINSEQEKYIYDNYINKGNVDASAIELLDEYAESNIEVDFSNDEPLKKNYNATSEKQSFSDEPFKKNYNVTSEKQIFSDEPLKKNYNATSEKQSFSDEQLQRKSKKTKTIVPKLDLETKPKTPRGRPRKT